MGQIRTNGSVITTDDLFNQKIELHMRKFVSLLSVLMLISALAHGQTRTVIGKVTDAQGQPLPFASVILKGKTTGVAADADGVFEVRNPGQTYDYKLTAEPFGLFPYHCHVMPVKKHIAKGLYGAFIIDPVDSMGTVTRPPADREMVMVMNGFDVDFDGENEFYSINGIANYYLDNPIQIRVGELVRIYLVNMTEFDPVNSFHLHGNMFRLYRSGTRFDPTATFDRNTSRPLDDSVKEWLYRDAFAEVADVVFLGQGERAILEFIPKYTGKFLFHAHQSEFVELGWTGLFNVV